MANYKVETLPQAAVFGVGTASVNGATWYSDGVSWSKSPSVGTRPSDAAFNAPKSVGINPDNLPISFTDQTAFTAAGGPAAFPNQVVVIGGQIGWSDGGSWTSPNSFNGSAYINKETLPSYVIIASLDDQTNWGPATISGGAGGTSVFNATGGPFGSGCFDWTSPSEGDTTRRDYTANYTTSGGIGVWVKDNNNYTNPNLIRIYVSNSNFTSYMVASAKFELLT